MIDSTASKIGSGLRTMPSPPPNGRSSTCCKPELRQPEPARASIDAALKRLVDLGGTVPAKAERGPAHLTSVLTSDIAKWHPILKAAMAQSKK